MQPHAAVALIHQVHGAQRRVYLSTRPAVRIQPLLFDDPFHLLLGKYRRPISDGNLSPCEYV
jgi:hypothetical protein